MKSKLLLLCLLLILFLCSCIENASEGYETTVSNAPGNVEAENGTPDWSDLSLKDYSELNLVLTDKNNEAHIRLLEEGKKRRDNSKDFVSMLLKFERGENKLVIPALDDIPLPQSDRNSFKNVIMGSESTLFSLPWIWTYCDYKDTELVFCLSYTDLLQKDDPPSTISDFIEENPDFVKAYGKNTKTEIVLFDGKKYECDHFTETDENARGHYFFIYHGLLIQIFMDHAEDILDDDFWNKLSFIPYENQ